MKTRTLLFGLLLLGSSVAFAGDAVSAAKLLGKWQGGRHVTQYFKDGTYILDPDITPQPIRESVSRWRVEDNHLITSDAAGTHTYTIQSLTADQFVIKDEKGRTYREIRVR